MKPIKMVRCLRCGHRWYPRTPERPATCASCRSPSWDKPPRKKIIRNANPDPNEIPQHPVLKQIAEERKKDE